VKTYTEKNIEKAIETLQEVYFDLCDFLENESCTKKLKNFQEFETLGEFLQEQKAKIAELESRLEVTA